jgi:cephalosporin-C deacetylase-like acetyl esterase
MKTWVNLLISRTDFILLISFLNLSFFQNFAADIQSASTEISENGERFQYHVEKTETQNDFTILYLTYPSPVKSPIKENNTISARLFLPSDIKPDEPKRPAVISLPILNGDENLNTMVCAFLAKHGVPSIMFTLPYYGERGNKEIRKRMENEPELIIQAIEQTFADIKRTADLLRSRPEIDPQKVGITGISFGGILSASAAEMDERFYKTALLLAGGDLLKIINHAKETRSLSQALDKLPQEKKTALQKKFAEIDPLTNASKLRARAANGRVLMLNAAQDEVIPRQCTERLAAEIGIQDKIIWFDGLGHYTVLAELPNALNILGNFFASDLPPSIAAKYSSNIQKNPPTPIETVTKLAREFLSFLVTEPEKGKTHYLNVELLATNKDSSTIPGSAQLIVGDSGRFSFTFKNLPEIGEGGFGFVPEYSWLATPKKLFIGDREPLDSTNAFAYVDPYYAMRTRAFAGSVMATLLVPDLVKKWVNAEYENSERQIIVIKPSDTAHMTGSIRLTLANDGETPRYFDFDFGNLRGRLNVYGWKKNIALPQNCFEPPQYTSKQEVSRTDLNKMIAALLNFVGEMLDQSTPDRLNTNNTLQLIGKAENGHGILCSLGPKKILIVDGTPEEMGNAHGSLLKDSAKRLVDRVFFGVGIADTFRSGDWFIDVMEEIYRRTSPYIPKRFIDECNSFADAAKLPRRDALYANLFPERFHCSGIAVKGRASLNGQILHARVLDYMRDIGIQNHAAVVVFIPEGKNAWMTLGYSGFIGTVTAMNEKGVAIGEMGGRGEGRWDGAPMSLMLRDVMERASTAEEAVNIIKNSKRTCEYYYVVSDKSGYIRALYCLPDKIEILKPGEQHPLLPTVPEDTVFVSGDERAKVLSKRLMENYGKIDVDKMIEIIKRPVAMKSNLHNAIFAPQTLDMWFADAGKKTPACDETYYKVNLAELIKFYRQFKAVSNN